MRATQSLKLNDPDGWTSNQGGPVWWIGSDALPTSPDWWRYGFVPQVRNRYGATLYGNRIAPPTGPGSDSWGLLPSITRATNLIVGPVVGTTWRYYSHAGSAYTDVRQGDEVITRPLWTVDPQLIGTLPGGEQDRPTVARPLRLGPHEFWETLLTHSLWWGAGALLYVLGSDGQPLAGTLRIVNPAMWAWTVDGRFVLDPDGDAPLESDADGSFAVGPVVWHMRLLRGFAPSDDTPSGALSRSGLILTAGDRLNSFLAGVLGTGVPSGVLKVSTPNYDETKAEALRARWMQQHGGDKRGVAVLNAGVDFTPLQLSVVDADLVNAKGSWLVDVAHAFGLSASWLDTSTGTGSNLTYANLGERRRDLLDHTLSIHSRRLEDLVSALLPFGTSMRVDWTGYLATDPREQIDFVTAGLAEGWLTIAEARDRMGLRPIDTGSDLVVDPGDLGAATPRELAEIVQKIYLGVDVVLTAGEARDILNRAGAGLTGPPPITPPSLSASPTVEEQQ